MNERDIEELKKKHKELEKEEFRNEDGYYWLGEINMVSVYTDAEGREKERLQETLIRWDENQGKVQELEEELEEKEEELLDMRLELLAFRQALNDILMDL